MKRTFILMAALALLGAACSSPASDSAESGSAASSTTVPTPAATTPETLPGGTTSTTATEVDKPKPEGPVAPDFTLALASGGDFTLSAGAKPVYMVFWAEW